MKFAEIIDLFDPAGDILGDALDDQIMVGTAVFGADENPVDAAGKVEKDGQRAAAAFVGAMPLGHQADAAMRATGLGDTVHVGFPRDETVELVMAAPEGVNEHSTSVGTDLRIEKNRWLAVHAHMIGHQAVAVPAVELFNDEKILALLLHIFNALRQGGKKFDRHLFVDKLHWFLLGGAKKRQRSIPSQKNILFLGKEKGGK